MDTLSFDIKGLDQTIKKMENLPVKLQRSGARKAARRGMNIVRDAARENARKLDDPKTSENIAKNIVVQSMSIRAITRIGGERGDIGMRVGVLGGARATGSAAAKTERRRARRGNTSLESLGEIAGAGKNNPGGDTWYWRFLEFGTAKQKAQPFMRTALSKNVESVTDKVATELSNEITIAVQSQ